MFGLRQAGQAWKCGVSVLDSEIALAAVYRCWRGDAKPGTSMGTSLDRNHWHTAGDAEHARPSSKSVAENWQGERAATDFWALPLPAHTACWAPIQVRDSSWLHLQQWLCWTIPWSNLHWAVSVQLGSIPRGSCLSTGCCWAVALQPFVWKQHGLEIQEHPSTQRAVSRKTGFELV